MDASLSFDVGDWYCVGQYAWIAGSASSLRLRAGDAAERARDEFVHADVLETRRLEVADHVSLRMGKPKRIPDRLAEAPIGRSPWPGALVIGGLADQVHFATGQQRIVSLPDDACDHLRSEEHTSEL